MHVLIAGSSFECLEFFRTCNSLLIFKYSYKQTSDRCLTNDPFFYRQLSRSDSSPIPETFSAYKNNSKNTIPVRHVFSQLTLVDKFC